VAVAASEEAETSVADAAAEEAEEEFGLFDDAVAGDMRDPIRSWPRPGGTLRSSASIRR
jgi:hypothetical protein